MNLADIVGRLPVVKGPGACDDRVVEFEMTDEGLLVTECCDGYFNMTLTSSELTTLIEWLQHRHNETTQTDSIKPS